MNRYSNFKDLKHFGFDALTGESDSLSLRILCDVTDQGRALFLEAFGLPSNTALAENWNSGTKEQPHIGSVLLRTEQIWLLALLGCIRTKPKGTKIVVVDFKGDKAVLALTDGWDYAPPQYDDKFEQVKPAQMKHHGEWQDWYTEAYGEVWRVFLATGTDDPLRNQHQVSGRIE